MKEKPEERLRLLARSAIVSAKGNTEKALEGLNQAIISTNDAALERTLCAEFRKTALRALLATHYNELRAEGKIVRPHSADYHVDTTDYGKTTWNPGPPAPRAPAPSQLNADAQRALQRQWLEEIEIYGMPLGDCTVSTAERWAETRKTEAQFVLNLIAGLPPEVKIRDFRTSEDAQKIWDKLKETSS